MNVMRFVSSVFLLLTIVVERFSAGDAPEQCVANSFKNDPALISALQGYLYTVSSSAPSGSNEIFKFDAAANDNIFTRTTSDNQCCRTMNVAATVDRDHFDYTIATDKDCPTQLSEKAVMKLVATNKDGDDSTCLILWTCRASRSGTHAFCTKNKVSEKQQKWIDDQFSSLKVDKENIVADKDYKDGKCFQKA